MIREKMVQIAKEYLYADLAYPNKPSIGKYALNRNLNYNLHLSFDRLCRIYGEDNITQKDIYHLIEAWIISHNEYPLITAVSLNE